MHKISTINLNFITFIDNEDCFEVCVLYFNDNLNTEVIS